MTASENPLRKDDRIRCPACGTEGESWIWALKRSPLLAAWTVEVFKCRRAGCGHIFALKD